MQYRMSKGSSFSAWMDQQQKSEQKHDEEEGTPFFAQFTNLQDNFVSQFQDLAGQLPDSGPLSSAFRSRLKITIFLLAGAVVSK